MSAKNYVLVHFTQDVQKEVKNSWNQKLNNVGCLTKKPRKAVVTLGVKLSTPSLPEKLTR